jgi:aryl-alcohol dehydrogenase-like predicted oxidoreductase
VSALPHRPLGSSGIEVSCLALGSWRTYERMDRQDGLAVMRTARERGIDFLDDARYNDETGTAPIPTGYSEVVFGELFRAAGWTRDEVVVANKLWWEFWPEQDAAGELDASLQRMGFDHLDLAYSEQPPDGLSVDDVVAQCGALIDSGKLRAWGLLNWPADLLAARPSRTLRRSRRSATAARASWHPPRWPPARSPGSTRRNGRTAASRRNETTRSTGTPSPPGRSSSPSPSS